MCSRALHSFVRRGVAAVELAVVLPLFLILLLGLWEVGRLVEVQQILTNGAREGARQASTGEKTVSQVKQTVIDYLGRAGIPTTNVTVTVENLTNGARLEPAIAEQLDQYRVTVAIPFNDVRWILLDQITGATNLTAVADWFSMKDVPLLVSPTVPTG